MIKNKIGFILFFCFALFGCQNRPEVHLEGKNIICFGDSLTQGVGVIPEESYPAILSKKLSVSIINAGVSGNTTEDALSRIEHDVLEKSPGLVIVEFGANDFFQRIPQQETRENLDKIIDRIQTHGGVAVLAAVKIGILFDDYYKVFKDVAKKRKVLLIPNILQNIIDDPKLKSDGMHPNAQGYQMIADKIYKYVAPLIKS